jgi:signal peptidase
LPEEVEMSQVVKPRKLVGNLLVLALLGLWYVTLAPTTFGGPAAYIEVSGHSMDGTYKTGDLILTRAQDTYEVGDIVVFEASGGQVIHRIIAGNGTKGYTLQGDNNPDPDPWHPTDDEVVGKAWVRFEGKAWIMHLPDNPRAVGIAAGLFTLVVLGIDAIPRRRKQDQDADPVATCDSSDADQLVGAPR